MQYMQNPYKNINMKYIIFQNFVKNNFLSDDLLSINSKDAKDHFFSYNELYSSSKFVSIFIIYEGRA